MKKAYKILTPSKLSFSRTFNKLVKHGFVWTHHRRRNLKSLNLLLFCAPPQIMIGTDEECKMVMTVRANLRGRGFRTKTITLSEFLKLETSGQYGK